VDARAELLARLVDAVHDGVFVGILGSGHDETLAANRSLRAMLGFPVDLPDRDFAPLAAERFLDQTARAWFLDRLREGRAIDGHLVGLRRADLTPIWAELTALAHPAAEPGHIRVEALFRDVTGRRRADEEVRTLHGRLLQAEKMAALGQTISSVAHELNNPLATILSWSERLAGKGGVDATVRRGLEIIHGESQRAARVARNLLTFARQRQTTRALVDLNQVVRATLALRADDQRLARVRTVEALAAGLPRLFADAHQLQQVLLNLVVNAEQATAAKGGTVVVRTWYDAAREAVLLEVNDDGPGLSGEARTRLFEPFFTTKGASGTGLGLTVAYAIVQEHGGSLRVESSAGRGASFFVELPVSGIGPSPEPVPRPPPAGAGESVLVVEDEAALVSAVVDALEERGYQVEWAADGEDALVKVSAHAFDVVVCDLKMPRVDGRAFYQQLVTSWPRLARRVVFVTGDVAGTDAEQFLTQSGRRWLPKPFRLEELLEAVRETLSD
jgi:signal transduction histidine kinase